MKRIKLNIIALFSIVSFSFVMTSCTKEELPSPSNPASAETSVIRKGAPAKGTDPIAQIAINEGFSELVGALSYVDAELNTGLVNLFLTGTDQYTVFAPTNQAFRNLYTNLSIDSINDLPATLVRDVLLYHVAEGRRAANSVVPRNGTRSINTLLQVPFTVNPQGQITAVGNTANITTPNISASNGIIHVIDAVILPIE